ncbi:MAG: right-handed parallel beta-helix repeat-containing protein [Candidatus Bathyarchaeota archaeon]|nr:right-handed parallel beta-helix repeat-containing protein [Candidatus Bathyarchaeum sp.]
MRKGSALALILLLCSIWLPILDVRTVKAEAKTIVVPEDYATIQEAVDAASDGDTVFVKSGIYNESVSIDVAISLIGEDPATTTIIGDMRLSGTVVLIRHHYVNITGFTIQPSSYSWTRRGVHLLHVSYCNVFGNVILNNEEGIWVYGCSTINITGNTVSGNGPGILLECSPANLICCNFLRNNNLGVRFIASPNNTLCNNTIFNNLHGLVVDSDGNSILDNIIEHNRASGIELLGVNNILKSNKLNNNTLNFDIDPKLRVDFRNSQFLNDVDSSNTIEGKPIIFWINKQGQTVPEDAAVVVLVNCENIIVENLHLSKNPVEIILMSTVNSKVTNNSVEAPDYVIFVHNSSGNTIANNFVWNGGIGIFLHSSSQNEVIGNSVTEATSGITLEFSKENIIDGNFIFGGFVGIRLDDSNNNVVRKNVVKDCEMVALSFWRNASQNLFFLNSIFNNTKNVEPYLAIGPVFQFNIWDNGTIGNYWGDYVGTDDNEDGIGDSPYEIPGVKWDNDAGGAVSFVAGYDNYPLTEPYLIPEFSSWAPLLVTLVAVLFVAVVYRKRLAK